MCAKTLFAGWADMDFNSHMKNTAFLDKAADVRMMFFAENDFPMDEFSRLRVGPAVMKDEVEYRKEVGLMQEITVTLAIAGHSEDGSRYMMRNEILRADGTLCARVTSTGGWLDFGAAQARGATGGVAQGHAIAPANRRLPSAFLQRQGARSIGGPCSRNRRTQPHAAARTRPMPNLNPKGVPWLAWSRTTRRATSSRES